jgi:hypothetical protein
MLASNGCEVNLTNDKNNCNGCGNVCATSTTVTSTTCIAGTCEVATCASDTYDKNGEFSDGCECAADAVGNNCGAAVDLGTISIDLTPKKEQNGNLVGPADTDEDWYKVTFATGATCSYTPSVFLTGDPEIKMQVFTSCTSSTPGGNFACNTGEPANSAVSTGVTSWEIRLPGCGDMTAVDPTPRDGTFIQAPSTIFVRVFKTSSSATCQAYKLTIGN